MRHRARALLPAREQRTRPAAADVQPQELGELAADRHLAPPAALAAADDDHPLSEADVLDPQLDQLGDPGPGLEQGLQHQPGPPAPGVGLVDEPEFLFEREAVDRAAAVGRCPEPGLLAGGFEHRLALLIVDALAGEDGGDGRGDARDAARGGFADRFSGGKLMPAGTPGRQAPPGRVQRRTGPGFPLLGFRKAHPASPGGTSCESGSCSRSRPTTPISARRRRWRRSRSARLGSRTSACRSPRARPCSPPPSAGWSSGRPPPGSGAAATAPAAAGGSGPRAATRSCSARSSATSASPARASIGAGAGSGPDRRRSRRSRTASRTTSRRSGSASRPAGPRWRPTPPRPRCSPTSCRRGHDQRHDHPRACAAGGRAGRGRTRRGAVLLH